MLNMVIHLSGSLASDDSGKLLVQLPHEKEYVKPPSFDGTSISSSEEELTDHSMKIHEMSPLSDKIEYAQTPHDKDLVEPPSLDGRIPLEELVDHHMKIHEMSLSDRVEYAQELKGQAAKDFASKDYKAAYQAYARAVDLVQTATETSCNMGIDGRVHAVMLVITCSIKAAVCSRNLEQWDEAERLARNATAILDSLEPRLGENIRVQVDQTAYSRIFGEWRVKSLMVMAQASAEKQNTEQAIKLLTRAQDVIAEYSAPEFAQQPLLKPSVKRLRGQDKEVLRLQAQCIRQRQAELREIEQTEMQQRAREILGSSPQVANGEEKKEEADPQPVCSAAVEETPAPLSTESLPNGSTSDSTGGEISTIPKEDATLPFYNAQGHQGIHNYYVRALTGVLATILVLGFAVRSSRRQS
jgi:tetratricopeptide (TPR) repeat protein